MTATVQSIKKDTCYSTILNDESNYTCRSYYNWGHRYRNRCYYSNGNLRSISNCGFLGVLRSKTWDENGRLVRKYRKYPFRSTSFVDITREKVYNSKGHLIKYEYIKKNVSCFGGGIIKHRVIEYDDNRKVRHRVKKNRKDFAKD